MIIPHFHFYGDCADAITIYEKAFNTKVEYVEYRDNEVAHAEMNIHGQKVYLNDRFGNKDKALDCAIHIIVTFPSVEELLACYENLKEGSCIVDPFNEAPFCKLGGNFMDKFGVLWGFMTVS